MREHKRGILKERNFWLLLYSRSVSSIGEWVLLLTLLTWAGNKTGNVILGGWLFAAKLVVTWISEIIAGAYADRLSRRTMMMVSDVVRGGLIGIFVLLNFDNNLSVVFAVLILFTVTGSFYSASSVAIVPTAIKPRNLLTANTVFTVSLVTTLALGAPLSTLLLAVMSLKGLLITVIVMFVSSGFIVLMLKDLAPYQRTSEGANILYEIREGLTYLAKSPKLRWMIPLTFPVALGVGPLIILVPEMAQKNLGLSLAASTNLFTLMGLGVLIGFAVTKPLERWLGMTKLASLGLVISGGAVIFFCFSFSFWSAVPPLILAGTGVIISYAATATLLQYLVPDEYMGRATMGLFGTGAFVGGLSSLASGYLANATNVRFSLGLAGGLILLAGLMITRLIPVGLRDVSASQLSRLKKRQQS